MRQKPNRAGLSLASVVLASCLLLTSFAGISQPVTLATAAPSTAAIRAKQAEVEAATATIDELAAQVELASEDYFEAQSELESIEASITITEARLVQAQRELEAQQAKLAARANAIYREGQGSFLEMFLGVSSFQDFINAYSFMQRVGQSDAEILVGIRQTRAEIAAVQKDLESQRTVQVGAVKKAADTKKSVDAKLKSQQTFLANLNSELSSLIAQERARREAAAREAAARAAADAAESDRNASNDDPVSGGRTPSDSLGSAHPEVVTIARRFVGVTPYVWGGTTPSGFDCSGLVLYCYREIGINLPRTSRSQYRVGDFIPADRTDLLQPGDLLFFGYDRDPDRIHHVAIYSGGGKMIHAPYTGAKVSETYLSTRSDYVGATRP